LKNKKKKGKERSGGGDKIMAAVKIREGNAADTLSNIFSTKIIFTRERRKNTNIKIEI